MKNLLAVSAMSTLLALGGIAAYEGLAPRPAQAAATATPATKIGFVDLNRTLNQTKAGKNARAKLEKEKKDKQAVIDKAEADLKKKYADLEKQKGLLKEDVFMQKARAFQEEYVKFQEQAVKLQQELAMREAKLTDEIFQKAAKVIESIVKRDGYTMMLEKTESAVLFADKALDITDEVNKRLDAGEGAK